MKVKATDGDPVAIDTWQDALAHAGALWRLMSSRWLALRLPRTRTTRQRLAPQWETLHACGFACGTWTGTDADLYREARQAGSERTTAQLAGYLARGFAEHRFHDDIAADLDEALPIIIGRARQHAELDSPIRCGADRLAARRRHGVARATHGAVARPGGGGHLAGRSTPHQLLAAVGGAA